MSQKKENVFKAAGLNEIEVKKWQKEKGLEKLANKPLCQLYNRVVLKKTLKAPYPVFTVKEIWDRIEEFNSGTRDRPSSNKIFVGIKEATVVGLHNTIRYVGCPKCLKGMKKIGADYCSAHEGGMVELVDLAWNEWLIYSDEDEFIVKMNPSYMHKYTEENMTGATVWVEGVINLAEDPLMMMVSSVREFEPGELLGGNIERDVDMTSGREDVDLAGFEEEEEEKVPEKNPFLDKEPKPAASNGTDQVFVNALLNEWTSMLEKWAVEPVKKASVERYILDWISNNYPNEFDDDDKAKEKLWSLVEGTYTDADDDRIVSKSE